MLLTFAPTHSEFTAVTRICHCSSHTPHPHQPPPTPVEGLSESITGTSTSPPEPPPHHHDLTTPTLWYTAQNGGHKVGSHCYSHLPISNQQPTNRHQRQPQERAQTPSTAAANKHRAMQPGCQTHHSVTQMHHSPYAVLGHPPSPPHTPRETPAPLTPPPPKNHHTTHIAHFSCRSLVTAAHSLPRDT
jgi:hypothetical protein